MGTPAEEGERAPRGNLPARAAVVESLDVVECGD